MAMVDSQLVLYDEDYRKVLAVCERLARDSHAKGVFVVDNPGQLLAEAGYTEIARRLAEWGYVALLHGWKVRGDDPPDALALALLPGISDAGKPKKPGGNQLE